MSTLTCACGHAISDSSYPPENEHVVISVRDHDEFLSRAAARVSEFLAKDSEARDKWVREAFGNGYPEDWTAVEVVGDTLTLELQECSRSMASCPQCGRLILQLEVGGSEYRSHHPD